MAKILIVDDEESVRDMLIKIIEPEGHEVLLAENGVDASVKCSEDTIDLIITDIVMPNTNGIDFIMSVKKTQPNIPVIAISGGGGIAGRYDYLEIAKLVGANKIFKKPFDIGEFRAAVVEAINT